MTDKFNDPRCSCITTSEAVHLDLEGKPRPLCLLHDGAEILARAERARDDAVKANLAARQAEYDALKAKFAADDAAGLAARWPEPAPANDPLVEHAHPSVGDIVRDLIEAEARRLEAAQLAPAEGNPTALNRPTREIADKLGMTSYEGD
jgi:hypothetical protein